MNPRPKKWRSKDYKKHIKSMRCLYMWEKKSKCEGPVDPHHLKSIKSYCPNCGFCLSVTTDGGMGLTPSDFYCVPLCRKHHNAAENHPEMLWEDFPDLFHKMLEFLASWKGKTG